MLFWGYTSPVATFNLTNEKRPIYWFVDNRKQDVRLFLFLWIDLVKTGTLEYSPNPLSSRNNVRMSDITSEPPSILSIQ